MNTDAGQRTISSITRRDFFLGMLRVCFGLSFGAALTGCRPGEKQGFRDVFENHKERVDERAE